VNLPAEFVSTIQNTFREEGDAFLKALPFSISEASAKWGLTNVHPSPVLSYNFVAFADRLSAELCSKWECPAKRISANGKLRLFNGKAMHA
jgi:hypothetical protein